MDRREIAFDPSILSIIADQRQLGGEAVTLGQACRSGTYQLWRKARDLVEEFLSGRQYAVMVSFLAGESFSQIAASLGISKSSAVGYYRKALKKLQKGAHDQG